jgi:SAM-dependent methyltransferase
MPTGPLAAERAELLSALRVATEQTAVVAPRVIRFLDKDWPQTPAAQARDELLGEFLLAAPIYPTWLEGKMTALRRGLLLDGVDETTRPLLGRLAIQCHLNEYVWAADAEEQAKVAELAARSPRLGADELLLLAAYRPLAELPGVDALMARPWAGPVQAVLQEQVAGVRAARACAAEVPAITVIRGGVSEDVRAQYEVHPYPRWRRAAAPPVTDNIFGRPIPAEPELLIAGCGTGRHAIEASRRYAGARLTAVDLSRASLGYALMKTREAGIGIIDYAQADLLELPALGRRFDMIESAGVLHHLDDPFEGARALVEMLKPGGRLRLGLYSATARTGLKPAKALARQYGPGRVAELRQAILAAPPGDPLRGAAMFGDFYAASSCRDLVMHVQEHEMTIADLQRIVDENGLTFLGFAHTPEVKAAYRAMFPDDPRGLELSGWAAFEAANPMTFAGMYQFWLEKPA